MRFLLPILTLVAAEIEQEWRLDNTNSVLSGPMSSQMVKEIAEIAFKFLKTKHRPRILLKRTKKPSFMDYDDAMSKQSLAVDAPAPMVMLNHDAALAVATTTLLPIIRRKPIPRKGNSSASERTVVRRGMSRSRKMRKPTPSSTFRRRNGLARYRRKNMNP